VRILLTGAAGYVGSVLGERLLKSPHVDHAVLVDSRLRSPTFREAANGRLQLVVGSLDKPSFVQDLERHLPLDGVIHAAFLMRSGYGKRAREIHEINLSACRNVFDFCFRNGVPRLVYLSSGSIYGPCAANATDHFFTETEPFGEATHHYVVQKREAEDLLRELYRARRPATQVVVLRPCSITGPRGQREPANRISLIAFLRRLLPVVPQVSGQWARQFLHEDDLGAAIEFLLRTQLPESYVIFNLAPRDYMTAIDVAACLGKRSVRVPAWLVNLSFHLLWHVTRGRMPTPPGLINFLRYPINLDGTKISALGFRYRYSSRESFLAQ
jgi:UDP-glucose 4-epimerase